MTLLPNEQQIATPNDQVIVLTNQRIQKVVKEWSSSLSVTIFLEDISSIETRYENNIGLLVLAILSALASVYFFANSQQQTEGAGMGTLVLGIVLLVAWLASRQYIIKISSKGGSAMTLNVTSLKKATADELADQIAYTKGNRVSQIHKLE